MPLRIALIGLGIAAGFVIGFLTRPSLLGQKYPLGLLNSSNPVDSSFKAELMQHLGLTTGLGLLGAAVLVWALAAAKKI